jgi:hypothetical protein
MAVYTPPPALAAPAGEPSIGAGFKDDSALALFPNNATGTVVRRLSWDDAKPGAPATWSDASPPPPALPDPFLWTDRATGRTLVTSDALVGGISWASDDEGRSWLPTQPPTLANYQDHPTIGGGPRSVPVVAGIRPYPNAVYYCAESGQLTRSECARSDDGGSTWLPPRLITVGDCAGWPGPPIVTPSGLVALAYAGCTQDGLTWTRGLMVSADGGVTWQQRRIPSLLPGPGDSGVKDSPRVASDRAGRLYFVTASNGHPVVVTSGDGGRNWSRPGDLGAAFGIGNAEFPMAAAGDAGRAAVAFYGSTTGGDDQSPAFRGVWHLYVAETIDAGETWTVVDATPTKPIMRGRICMGGTTGCTRTLSDFQSMTTDAHGRVLISYLDACTSRACVSPAGQPSDSVTAYPAIARQVGGPRLAAAADPPGAVAQGTRLPPPPPTPVPTCGDPSHRPPCVPTPAQCASGSAPLAASGGAGTVAACVGSGGHVLAYAGGNPASGCMDVVLDGKALFETVDDPNRCP